MWQHTLDPAHVSTRPRRVLFVCTHNSARSIMAEALLRAHGGDRFEAHSAGTEHSQIRPLTLRVLEDADLPAAGLRSKSTDELIDETFDVVITVCDDARDVCPTFPGPARRLHWSFDDPARAQGSEAEQLREYRRVFKAIGERIDGFIAAER